MKSYKKPTTIFLVVAFLVAFVFFTLLMGGNSEPLFIISQCDNAYYSAIKSLHPEMPLKECQQSSTTSSFSAGESIATYENMASPLVLANNEYVFTPQIVQTVVIAIDRSKTDETIESFADLMDSTLPINFDFDKMVAENMWEYPMTHQIVISMAQALHGEYDIDAVAQDFEKLNNQGRFFVDDLNQPVTITYDSTAAALIKQGHSLEIVVPSDGTISLAFGAMVFNDTIAFDEHLDDALLNFGYRLTDGRADLDIYPSAEQYVAAIELNDYSQYNSATYIVSKTLRRDAFDSKQYSFANAIETSWGYLVILVALVLYIASVTRRITNKTISTTLIMILTLMLVLVTLGLFKSINNQNPVVETALWYSYYVPFLFIPTLFVYISRNLGKLENSKPYDRLTIIHFAVSALMLLFVFTNDLHGLVFIIHDHLITSYEYNFGYYVILSYIVLCIVYSFVLIFGIGMRSPNRLIVLYPFLSLLLMLVFGIGYIFRLAFLSELDISFTLTLLIALFIESCIQSTLFPSNRGYKKLFLNSNLAMEIYDNNMKPFLKSFVIRDIDENFALRRNDISGGSISYFEDYTSLNTARTRLASINKELRAHNEFLMQKGTVNAELATFTTQSAVYDSVDDVLEGGTKQIETLLDLLRAGGDKKKIIGRISIIACGLKRECMLLIGCLYQKNQSVNILLSSLNEMSEFTESIGMKLTVGCTISGDMPPNSSVAVYRLFSSAVKQAAELECKHLLVQLYEKEDVVFSVIADTVLFDDQRMKKIAEIVADNGGTFTSKAWNETESYLLTFKKEVQDV